MTSMARREFIKSTTAFGAGLFLARSAFAQQQPKTLKLGMIGTGMQGQNLINTIIKMGKDSGVTFVAICDLWEDLNLSRTASLLSRLGQDVKTYTDYKQMLQNEKLDAVIVATPDFCHAEHTIACLQAGVHVYCEAPMSNSVEDAEKMVEAAKTTGKLLQIGHQRRSNARYIHCYNNLLGSAKILGQLTAASAQWNRPARPDIGWSKRKALDEQTLAQYGYSSMHQFKNWRWYKGLGSGLAVSAGTHQVDIFNWFLNTPPKTVTAKGGTYYYDTKNHHWPDTVMAIFEYETRQGIVTASYQSIASNGYGGYYEAFLGNEGSLEISESPSRGGIYRDPQAPKWEKWVKLDFLKKPDAPEESSDPQVSSTRPPTLFELPIEGTEDNYQPHLRNFFDAIAGKAELTCPAKQAIKTTAAILKINEAIEKHITIENS